MGCMQVGYGDVVAISVGGKLAIVAIICVGVVLIPVQTSQLYQQLVARRVTQGMHCPCSSLESSCHGAQPLLCLRRVRWLLHWAAAERLGLWM